MKFTPASGLLAGLIATAVSVPAAAYEFSGNVAIVNDYLFRGVSQSSDDPSVMGGFDIAFDNGIYIGTFGAAVNWPTATGDIATMEWDIYVGYAGQFNDVVSYDVGYIRYEYPGQDDGIDGFDFNELYASVSAAGATAGFAWSDDFWGGTGDDDDASYWYVYGAYSYPISDVLSLDAEIGYNAFESNEAWNDYFGSPNTEVDSYVNWSIGASYTLMDGDSEIVTFSATYADTDISEEECAFTRICEAKLVLGVSKSL